MFISARSYQLANGFVDRFTVLITIFLVLGTRFPFLHLTSLRDNRNEGCLGVSPQNIANLRYINWFQEHVPLILNIMNYMEYTFNTY